VVPGVTAELVFVSRELAEERLPAAKIEIGLLVA
jgi:hypothetical protein